MTKDGGEFFGRPPLRLREMYVPAVLRILLDGAEALAADDTVAKSSSENHISGVLERHMRRQRMEKGESDVLSWFLRPMIPAVSQVSSELVEPDFMFTWAAYPSGDDSCLMVEAKRLRGSGISLAGGYVTQGVMRFVEGSYGRGHDYGIMIGYVVTPAAETAVNSVKMAMDARREETRERAAFLPNASKCSHPHTHHSQHCQVNSEELITLVHLFVEVA